MTDFDRCVELLKLCEDVAGQFEKKWNSFSEKEKNTDENKKMFAETMEWMTKSISAVVSALEGGTNE